MVQMVKNPPANAGDWVQSLGWEWLPTHSSILAWKSTEESGGLQTMRSQRVGHRHSEDTSLMAESEEELKRLLMMVKQESEKAGLKLNIQ